MNISRYKIPITIIVFNVILNIVLITLFGINQTQPQDLSYILPFTDYVEILILFIIIWPIMAILGGFLGSFISPALIWIHKAVFGRNVSYGIEEVQQSKKFRRTFLGFFPSLMAINISMLISDYAIIQRILITEMWFLSLPGSPQIISFIVGVTFALIISFALFSGLWAISDAGIVFSNRKTIEKKGKEKPVMAQSIGSWYNYLLKGYAGIGVLVAYYELAFLFLGAIGFASGTAYISFFNIYIFLGLFIILPLLSIPAIIVLDVLRDWRVEFTRKFATKLGIVQNVEIEMKEIN